MPPKTDKAAIGLYLSGVGLESLLDDLTRVGFHSEDVCIILPQTHSAARVLLSSRAESRPPSPGVEAVADWFAQFGAVIVPRVGAFVAGPEFVGTLFASGNGEVACGNALEGLGLPPAQVQQYQHWVSGGGVIVYVCCQTVEQVHHAIEVLEEAGAEEVALLYAAGPRRQVTMVPLRKAS